MNRVLSKPPNLATISKSESAGLLFIGHRANNDCRATQLIGALSRLLLTGLLLVPEFQIWLLHVLGRVDT